MNGDENLQGEARSLLRNAGLRATASRIAVLRVLQRADRALSHTEVCRRVVDLGYERTTVWRNLAALVDGGLVLRLDAGDRLWRFTLHAAPASAAPTSTARFVCRVCGRATLLPFDALRVREDAALPRALASGAVEIRIRGVCDECSAASATLRAP